MSDLGSPPPLVLLWHHHQPLYRDLTRSSARGSYRKPWVRLHALRDYYGMAALGARYPAVRLTINFSASLLWQIEDYVENGASDEALELTLRPAEDLDERQRHAILSTFFEAEAVTQILPHRRYRELFEANQKGASFSTQDLRDLQMWFNLAWFASELRQRAVTLATGETLDVARFLDKERGFDHSDLEAMVAEQRKLLRAILPLHRQLQERGRIEVAISPFYHPVLPLLVDSGSATLDRPGAVLPRRFRHPEDAEAQVQLAVEAYQRWFGQAARGAWPPEGAVSPAVIPILARAKLGWTASDQGVLGRSGRWGYRAEEPEVRCRVYRAVEGDQAIALFFRDTELSNEISFRCQHDPDPVHAAQAWLGKLRTRDPAGQASEGAVVTVALDGENAWGAYREDGRPFLDALYRGLDREGATVTPSVFLERHSAPPSPVYELFTGSWIDEMGSAPGVDLGTWIGEPEENQAWNLLSDARDAIEARHVTAEAAPLAYQALYAAEGSDWFWWYGADQPESDPSLDELFRTHLRAVYLGAELAPPPELEQPIVPPQTVWTAERPARAARVGERLTVRAHCPATLLWAQDDEPVRELALVRSDRAGWYQASLGPFLVAGTVKLTVRCTRELCGCGAPCCAGRESRVRIWPS